MSKLVALVASSVLISLAVSVGISADLSGRLGRAFTASAPLAVGVRDRAFLDGQPGIAAPADMYYQFEGDHPHGCHSELYYDPADD